LRQFMFYLNKIQVGETMKSFITKSGETAYVPTDSEKEVIQLALKVFNNSLPKQGEGVCE